MYLKYPMHQVLIGPEYDNWLPYLDRLTKLTPLHLEDVTLACENANSKLVEVVTVANVDDEDSVGNSLLQIWELRFGHKA